MKQTTYLATLPQVNARIEQGFEPASDIGPVKRPWQCLTDGFFDEVDIRECLHVTVRIANDFYAFLIRFGETPCRRGYLCDGYDKVWY
jgi:hypothetical protein